MHVTPSIDDLTATWRLLMLRAVIILPLAVIGLPWPRLSIAALIVIVSAIVVVAALFDAALAGALHARAIGAWALLPEAALGFVLGGAILLYPLVPLWACGALLAAWIVARGFTVLAMVRARIGDASIRMVTAGWLGVSILVPVALAVVWREMTILSLVFVVVAYAIVWSVLEFAVGLYLRSTARRLAPAR